MKKLLAVCLFLAVFTGFSFLTQAQTPSERIAQNEFLEKCSPYIGMIKFFHADSAARDARPPINITNLILTITIDTVVGIICLALALYFVVGVKGIAVKNYFYFLLALNIGWFCILLLNYFCWGILNFLVLRLRPELKNVLTNFFCGAFIVDSVILYLWLLARNFSLNFFGAVGVFLVSQVVYFASLFIFAVAAPSSCYYCNVFNMNNGFIVAFREYCYDVYKISSHQGVLSFLRFRGYHM